MQKSHTLCVGGRHPSLAFSNAVLQSTSLAFSNAATSLACAGRATRAFVIGRMGSLMGAIGIHHFRVFKYHFVVIYEYPSSVGNLQVSSGLRGS